MASVMPMTAVQMFGPGSPSMTKKYCDLYILCENKIWKAHRVLLSATSKRLSLLIAGSEKVNDINILVLNDHVDAATVERLLRWCYNLAIEYDDSQLTFREAPPALLKQLRKTKGPLGLTERCTGSDDLLVEVGDTPASHEDVDGVSEMLEELNLNGDAASEQVKILSSILRLYRAAVAFNISSLQKLTIGELTSHAPAATHQKGFVAFVRLTISFSRGDILSYRPCYIVADACAESIFHLWKDRSFCSLLKRQPMFLFLLMDKVVRLHYSKSSTTDLALQMIKNSSNLAKKNLEVESLLHQAKTSDEVAVKQLEAKVSKITADNDALQAEARATAANIDQLIAYRDITLAELKEKFARTETELASKVAELQQLESKVLVPVHKTFDQAPKGYAEADDRSVNSELTDSTHTTAKQSAMSRRRQSIASAHRGVPTFFEALQERKRVASVADGAAQSPTSSTVTVASAPIKTRENATVLTELTAPSIKRPATASAETHENAIVSPAFASSSKAEAIKKENLPIIPPHRRTQGSATTFNAAASPASTKLHNVASKASVTISGPRPRNGVVGAMPSSAPTSINNNNVKKENMPVLTPRPMNGKMSATHQTTSFVDSPIAAPTTISTTSNGLATKKENMPVLIARPMNGKMLAAHPMTDFNVSPTPARTATSAISNGAAVDRNDDGAMLPPHMRPEVMQASEIRKLKAELAAREQEIKTLRAGAKPPGITQWGLVRPASPPRSRQRGGGGGGGGHMHNHQAQASTLTTVMRGGRQPLAKVGAALKHMALDMPRCTNIDCGVDFPFDFRGITNDPNAGELILKCAKCHMENHRWIV